MSDPQVVADYTKARLHSKSHRGRRIERCPECGQKGEYTRYSLGGEIYAHRFTKGLWATTLASKDYCVVGKIG